MVVPITVDDRDQLRRLRTELELLWRIHQGVCTRRSGSRRPHEQDALRELGQILGDAREPVITEMITRIDRDFSDVREEIMMSTVNEEAERIAQEVVAAGVAGSTDVAGEADSAEAADASACVNEALAEAEAALAEAAGVNMEVAEAGERVDSLPTETTDVWSQSVGEPVVEPQTAAEVDVSEATVPVDEPLAAEALDIATDDADDDTSEEAPEVQADAPDVDAAESVTMSEAGETPTMSEAGETVPAEAAMASDVTEPAQASREAIVSEPPSAETPANEPSQVDADSCEDDKQSVGTSEETEGMASNTPDRPSAASSDPAGTCLPEQAEEVVAEIENGIRRLASVLSTEVEQQWSRARKAADEVLAARARLEEAHQAARAILDEVTRIKEAVMIAHDDSEVARRETQRFREDAKRAKERADASADTAEQAADRAGQEALAAKTLAGS